jgi:hypothetical protein
MKSGLKSHLEYTAGATVTIYWLFLTFHVFKFLYFLNLYIRKCSVAVRSVAYLCTFNVITRNCLLMGQDSRNV